MGAACSKGSQTVAPRSSNPQHQQHQQHQQQKAAFEHASSNAVVSYAASELDGDADARDSGARGGATTVQRVSGAHGVVLNPPSTDLGGGLHDSAMMPGALARRNGAIPCPLPSDMSCRRVQTLPHTAPVRRTGVPARHRAASQPHSKGGTAPPHGGHKGKGPSSSGGRAATASTAAQTEDEWLDWLAAGGGGGLMGGWRMPTMPASWSQGGPIGSGSFGTVFLAMNNHTGGRCWAVAVAQLQLLVHGGGWARAAHASRTALSQGSCWRSSRWRWRAPPRSRRPWSS